VRYTKGVCVCVSNRYENIAMAFCSYDVHKIVNCKKNVSNLWYERIFQQPKNYVHHIYHDNHQYQCHTIQRHRLHNNTNHTYINLRNGEAPSSLLSNPLLRIISSDEATLGETVYIGEEVNEKADCILCANPSKNKLLGMLTIIVE